MGIFDLVSSAWPIILASLAGLVFGAFKLIAWWQGKHIEGLEHTVQRQDNAIEAHEANAQSTSHDREIDEETEGKIDAVEDKLGQGEESDANTMSNALNDFFGSKKDDKKDN